MNTLLKQQNNRGFSLIELIITVAILAVLVSVASMNISLIYGFDVKEGANDTNSLLSKCKVSTLSRAGKVYLEIYKDDTGCYALLHENGDVVSNDKIGGRRLNISYYDGEKNVKVDEDNPLFISFERTTGALASVEEAERLAGKRDDSEGDGDMKIMSEDSDDSGRYCNSIIFESSSNKREIVFSPDTGAHYIR